VPAEFQLDVSALDETLSTARAHAGAGVPAPLLARLHDGGTIDLDELALLWVAPALDAEALLALAAAARRRRPAPLETFSPLYLTNTCDAECRMCGMRRDNQALARETVDLETVETQLRTLRARGMHGVALLTGEYRRATRDWALRFVNQALHSALRLGFRHVLLNAGAFDADEYEALLADLPRDADGAVACDAQVTMCTFQETYSTAYYARFMGGSADNPRANFGRRLANCDRARAAGLRVANPGILVGLNPDLGYELLALTQHARHLLAHGMQVYLSVPRLRQIAGSANQRGADDASFLRLVALLSLAVPEGKIVLTTREPAAIQRRLVPIVSVLSAGSAAVAPYTADGARFPLESSQFEVIDQRRFEEILGEHVPPGGRIVNFDPPRAAV
jgi:2-iminoacetate synthase